MRPGFRTPSGAGGKAAAQAQAAFTQALALHQQGQLAQAQEGYQQVLKLQPRHFDAVHLLGVVAYQSGQPARAVPLIRQALQINPRHAFACNNLGLALGDTGEVDAALEHFDKAIALKADYAEAYCNRGSVLRQMGQSDAAIGSYDKAIALKPDYAEAHYNRGNVLRAAGQAEAAIASYQKAMRLKPGYAEACNNCGNAYRDLEDFESALEHFNQAIAAKAAYADAHNNRGATLRAMKQYQAAVESYDQAIALKTGNAEAWFNRGNALGDMKAYQKAIESYEQAIALQPDHAGAYCNRGDALGYLHQHREALESFDRAIALEAGHADAYNNRGNALGNLKQHRAALESYEKAISLQPAHARAHLNLAFGLLQAGDFQSGWKHQEWRWEEAEARKFARHFTQPLWLGDSSLQGKTILLHAEQGLGDTLQFCRYAKLVAALGAHVVLEVPAALMGLLSGLEGVAQLVTSGGALPPFDCHCPLLSLPLAFRTDLQNMPGNAAYLSAPADQVAAWTTRLGDKTRPRVGLVWSGNAVHKNDHNRSIPLAELVAHLPEGLDYISLQKEVRGSDRDILAASPRIRQFDGEIQDFTDTAALCTLVDVVLSVDTSVAHLAGALGRPVWIALPFNPDWRWMLDRSDSPWYTSARLYRQSRSGEWEGALRLLAADLAGVGSGPEGNPLGA